MTDSTLQFLPLQEGRQAADPALGRYLADTLSAVPKFSSNDFERLFNENVQVRSAADSIIQVEFIICCSFSIPDDDVKNSTQIETFYFWVHHTNVSV